MVVCTGWRYGSGEPWSELWYNLKSRPTGFADDWIRDERERGVQVFGLRNWKNLAAS